MSRYKIDDLLRIWTVLIDQIGAMRQERGLVAVDFGRWAVD